MTFSIVAHDGAAWGVAVASKFLAAGSVVPWARAGAGALATQALANVGYGPSGLEMLAAGVPAGAVVDRLTGADDDRDHRQLGLVDRSGAAATFTGSACLDWAGGHAAPGLAVQGNILTGPGVVDAMVGTFQATAGDLAVRLTAALLAGDRAGGDRRGRQSAAVLVVQEGGGYLGGTDVAIDLRVDDHPDPAVELRRLLDLHRELFPDPSDLVFVDIEPELAVELRSLLGSLGYRPGVGPGYDPELRAALFDFTGTENLEARWSEGARIETVVLRRLRTAGRT